MRRYLGVAVAVVVGASTASADSSRFGLAISAGSVPVGDGGTLVGSQLAASHWIGRFGVSVEGAALARTLGDGGVLSAAASGHLQLGQYTTMVTALDGTRSPLSVGVELEAVAQHQWWDLDRATGAPSTMVGLGVAVTALSHDARRLVGIRAGVRLLVARDAEMDAVARRTSVTTDTRVHGVLVTIGTELGAFTN